MFSNTLLVFLVVYFISGSAYGQKVQISFRTDYTYIEATKSFYKIHMTPQTWADAKRECALEGATFWHPDNDDEARAVISFWDSIQPSLGWVYVGMSDLITKGQFETIDGKLSTEVYKKWEPGQPDNYGGKHNCIYMYKSGYLDNYACDYKYSFICKKSLQSLEWDDRCKVSVSDGQKVQISFRTDYTYIEATKSFYKIHMTPQTWADAKRECALEGATFWHPDNDDEARAVISFWDSIQPSLGWVYVGMSDLITKGQFETIDGKLSTEVYKKWEPGQPDNYGGKHNCIYMYKSGYLDNYACDYKYSFICKKSLQSLEWDDRCKVSVSGGQKAQHFFRKDYNYIEVVENFYKIHTTPRTWAEAKQVCALEGATFWHPDNDNEARALISFWKTTQSHLGRVYVGMSDKMAKGLFETIDGKSVSEVYNNWQPGQPDNHGGKQDCVYIYQNGSLDDCRCDDKYSFICKKSLLSLEWNNQCNIPDLDYTLNEDNGKCYKLHTTPMNWKDSYAACRLEQSNLAVIGSRQEADYLVNLTESTPKPLVIENYQTEIFHVGFHNRFNEGWQTVKGTPMDVDADVWWDNYQLVNDRDRCGSMLYTGRLIKTDCDIIKSFFICEHEFTNSSLEHKQQNKKQTI